MTKSLNGWQKLGVFISTLLAVSVISGCQKSDVDKCVDAQMEVVDENRSMSDQPREDQRSRKNIKAEIYVLCMQLDNK